MAPSVDTSTPTTNPLPYPFFPFLLALSKNSDAPLRWIPKAYQRLVLKNAPRVAAIERISRGIAFTSGGVVALLDATRWKGKLGDALYVQEFALMVVNYISTVHTALFSLSGLFPTSKSTALHTRLQNAFFRAQLARLGDSPYGVLVLIFQLIVFGEKVAEMWFTKHYGEKGRWNLVVVLEAIKSAIRLATFHLLTHRGPLPPRLIPERDLSLSMPKATGIPPPPLSTQSSSASMDSSTVSLGGEQLEAGDAEELVTELGGLEVLGEWAFIIRPVVYSLLLRRSSSLGTLKTSWTPYLASLSMDLFSLSISYLSTFQSSPTWMQEDELVRRLHLMLYYFLREPVFSNYARPALGRFFRYAGRRPVVNLTTFILMEYQAYWARLYFYVSASS